MESKTTVKESLYFQYVDDYDVVETCVGFGEYDYKRVYGKKHELTWQELHCKKANLEEEIERVKREKVVYDCGEDRKRKKNGKRVKLVKKIVTTIVEEEEL